jgi:hypothetical protein
MKIHRIETGKVRIKRSQTARRNKSYDHCSKLYRSPGIFELTGFLESCYLDVEKNHNVAINSTLPGSLACHRHPHLHLKILIPRKLINNTGEYESSGVINRRSSLRALYNYS